MSIINQYFDNHFDKKVRFAYPPVMCNDGFSMSVQASDFHQCSPKMSNAIYTKVEVGYPSDIEDLLTPFEKCEGQGCDGVFPYVPVEVVDQIIKKHGGLTKGE